MSTNQFHTFEAAEYYQDTDAAGETYAFRIDLDGDGDWDQYGYISVDRDHEGYGTWSEQVTYYDEDSETLFSGADARTIDQYYSGQQPTHLSNLQENGKMVDEDSFAPESMQDVDERATGSWGVFFLVFFGTIAFIWLAGFAYRKATSTPGQPRAQRFRPVIPTGPSKPLLHRAAAPAPADGGKAFRGVAPKPDPAVLVEPAVPVAPTPQQGAEAEGKQGDANAAGKQGKGKKGKDDSKGWFFLDAADGVRGFLQVAY